MDSKCWLNQADFGVLNDIRCEAWDFLHDGVISERCVRCACLSARILPQSASELAASSLPEGASACQKSYAFRYSRSPSADCESKIGDMRGDFRAILLAKSLPYTNERPGGPPVARPVSECNISKKCLKHFFDTLSSLREGAVARRQLRENAACVPSPHAKGADPFPGICSPSSFTSQR